jgi:hypothetical protein
MKWSTNPNSFKCPFCQTNEHHNSECQLSIEQRNQKVREHRGCLNCLNPGHFLGACKSKYRCKNCKLYSKPDAKHHTALCRRPVHKDTVKFVPRSLQEGAKVTPKPSSGATPQSSQKASGDSDPERTVAVIASLGIRGDVSNDLLLRAAALASAMKTKSQKQSTASLKKD